MSIIRSVSEKDRPPILIEQIESKLKLVRKRAKGHPRILAPLVEIEQLVTDLKSDIEKNGETTDWSIITSMLVVALKVIESMNE